MLLKLSVKTLLVLPLIKLLLPLVVAEESPLTSMVADVLCIWPPPTEALLTVEYRGMATLTDSTALYVRLFVGVVGRLMLALPFDMIFLKMLGLSSPLFMVDRASLEDALDTVLEPGLLAFPLVVRM